jgi:hypothetical protein
MLIIPQSIPIAERRRLYFTAVDSTNLQTRQTGLSGFTIRVKKAGIAEAAGANAVVQEDATDMPGIYYYELTEAEADTPGPGVVRISRAGTETREIPFFIEQAKFGKVQAGTLTPSSFTTSLSEANDYWKDNLIRFLTGSLKNQVKKVGAFANASGLITLATGLAFTGAPANNDVFELISR